MSMTKEEFSLYMKKGKDTQSRRRSFWARWEKKKKLDKRNSLLHTNRNAV